MESMTNSTNALNLKPRAIAVLVALRSGPRTTRQLRDAIGDGRKSDPNGLLRSMNDDHRLVERRPHDERWYLSHNGLGWLQSHGLDASDSAKQALYAATDAQAVRS